MTRVGAAMHAKMTAASLVPLNTDSVFGCCAEDVVDASGIRSDVNEGDAKGSDCMVDWVLWLDTSKPSELVWALVSLEASLVFGLKEKT